MLRNYFTVTWRNLLKNKGFSFINIFGLAIGMSACLVILQYAGFEMSYDTFHKAADRIYRVRMDVWVDGQLQVSIPKNANAAGLALKADFPEIEETVRIFPIDGTVAVKRDNIVFNEKGIYFTDPSFLQVFSYPLLEGDAATALTEPNTVVITASVARKFFGKEHPLGKTLVLREGPMDLPIMVKGVMADVPENSHLDFDFLVSHATLARAWGEGRANKTWGEAVFYTYVLLKPNADIRAVETKFPAFIEKYTNFPSNVKIVYEAQPLQDIYLHSDLVQEAKANGSSKEVYFLLLIALFIMLIAWFNYINLSTARSIERAKEVGIRKVVGAGRSQVFRQFIFESFIYNVLAIILALTILQLSQPFIIELIGKPLTFWSNTLLLFVVGVFFMAGAFISAIYPGLVLSAFKPIRVLKGKLGASASGSMMRKGFTVMQFAASITLIIGTLTVYQQLSYMRSKDLGMNISQTLVLNNPDVVDSTFDAKLQFFKNELMKHPEIKYVVSSTSIPGKTDNILKGGLLLSGNPAEAGSTHYGFRVDHHFIDAYDIKLLAGRNFFKDFATDKDAMIVNLAALKILGISRPEEAYWKKSGNRLDQRKNHIRRSKRLSSEILESRLRPYCICAG
jgi:putative ABC transport system permease protein